MTLTGADVGLRGPLAGEARRARAQLAAAAVKATGRDGADCGCVASGPVMITLDPVPASSTELPVAAATIASAQPSAPAPTGPQG